MSKLRVGIIFGGKSAEHEVSLQSAKNIVDAIDKNKYDVVLLGIDKQGQWHVADTSNYLLNANSPEKIALHHSGINVAIQPSGVTNPLLITNSSQSLPQIDVIFPIVHGTLGEDGSLQGLLRMANLPFVGSNVLASAASMDKDITKRLLRDQGLNVAPFKTVTRANHSQLKFNDIIDQLGLPLFVKPANQGSSVGVSKVTNEQQYHQAIALALSFDHKVLIESAIKGREIECAVLGNDDPKASTCGEIVVNSEFYSYNTKYIDENGAQVVVPAELSAEINDKIRATAIEAYQTLGCQGMARVDVFLTAENKIIINEINTLPGFTNISMYPKLWKASGVDYTQLISQLIDLALERHQQDIRLKSIAN